MHVYTIRRNLGRRGWRRFTLVAAVAVLFEMSVLLCSSAQAATPVAFVEVERQTGFLSSRSYGGTTVAARASELGFKQGGELAALYVDIGDRVERGTLLAELDKRSLESRLAQAEAELAVARANVAALEAEVELAANTEARFRTLRADRHVSEQSYDEARLALRGKRAQLTLARADVARADAQRQVVAVTLDEAELRAPFTGIVQNRYFDEGSQVNAGQPALRLVEADRVEAHVGLPGRTAATLERSGAFELRWNETRLPVTFRALLPEIDAATRTLTAVFTLPPQHAVPVGAVVTLALQERVGEAGFWVPVSALTAADRGLWGLYVANRQDVIERRVVEVLHTEADRAYVRGTLSDADRVVHTGVQRIVPGQAVSAVERSTDSLFARAARAGDR